jgi:hypothetical protein
MCLEGSDMPRRLIRFGPVFIAGKIRVVITFLLGTADHILDMAIITRMAVFDLEDCVACVLVGTEKKKLGRLPPTAGKVQVDKGNVIQRIVRNLETFDAIDAGFYLSRLDAFSRRSNARVREAQFLFIFIFSGQGTQVLRPSYELKLVHAVGDVWLSIKTQAQYDRIRVRCEPRRRVRAPQHQERVAGRLGGRQRHTAPCAGHARPYCPCRLAPVPRCQRCQWSIESATQAAARKEVVPGNGRRIMRAVDRFRLAHRQVAKQTPGAARIGSECVLDRTA